MVTGGTSKLSFILLLAVLATSTHALAQKPAWTPVAELLVGSISESDPRRMSTLMSRCTALNMVLAGLAPERSEQFRDEALRFAQRVIILESRLARQLTSTDPDMHLLNASIMERVKGMAGDYNQWMDHNGSTNGALIDKEVELEMSSCQLASRFLGQLQQDGRED